MNMYYQGAVSVKGKTDHTYTTHENVYISAYVLLEFGVLCIKANKLTYIGSLFGIPYLLQSLPCAHA